MNKYIDSEKLIKSVNRYRDNAKAAFNPIEDDADYYKGKIAACEDIQKSIISLQQEQPEVDLEEYIENEINHYGLSLYEASYGTFSASQIDRIIRNAFELGLKARKEE